MADKHVASIQLGAEIVAWQGHCLRCGSAYLVAHREQPEGAPRVRFCVVCGNLCVYTRLDGAR